MQFFNQFFNVFACFACFVCFALVHCNRRFTYLKLVNNIKNQLFYIKAMLSDYFFAIFFEMFYIGFLFHAKLYSESYTVPFFFVQMFLASSSLCFTDWDKNTKTLRKSFRLENKRIHGCWKSKNVESTLSQNKNKSIKLI